MSAGSIAGIVVAVVGTTVSTTLSVRASNTQEKAARYAAKAAREQAALAEESQRRKSRIELGRERVLLGKLGILPTAGSPLEQLATNAGEAERGAYFAQRGLLQEASQYDIAAANISGSKGLLAASNVLSGLAVASQYASPLLKPRTPTPTGGSSAPSY